MVNVNDLIGVRFVNHGRSSLTGFDCYGLAIEVSKRLGHTLDDLWYEKSNPDTFSSNSDSVITRMSDRVEETTEQKEGNLIVFFDERGRMIHIGVILEEGVFIHADIGGVRIVTLSNYYRKNWKVYSWRQ